MSTAPAPEPPPLSGGLSTRGRPAARLLEATALTALAAVAWLFFSRTIWDIDVFWHIAAGRAFVEAGAIPDVDIFSAIDPERTWVTFQWGYQVLVHLLDEAGGLALVKLAHSAVMLAGLGLFWWGCRSRLRLGPLAALVATVLMLTLFEDRIRTRPHVFNFLAWSLLFPWLITGPASLSRRAMVVMAVVVGIWANIHAGGALLFLIAAATLPASAIGARLLGSADPAARAIRPAVLWWLAGAVPALLSPCFIRGNMQALAMLEGTEHAIGEWFPSWHFLELAAGSGLWGHWLAGAFPTIVAVLWVLVMARSLMSKTRLATPGVHVLLTGLALLVLAHRSVRFVYIATFAALLIVPALPRPLVPAAWPLRLRQLAGLLAVGALLATTWQFNITAQHGDAATAWQRAFEGPPIDERRFPIAHADFLESTGFSGNIFCQANWGGYLLWRLHPRVRVTADGRGNYPREVTDDLAFVYDQTHFTDPAQGPAVQSVYERYPVDVVVHQRPVWPRAFVPPRSDWLPARRDAKGEIWARDTPAGRAWVENLKRMRPKQPPRGLPALPPPRPRDP